MTSEQTASSISTQADEQVPDIIERVATAIYREFENRPRYAQLQMNSLLAQDLAIAAIEAMREPMDGHDIDALTRSADDQGLFALPQTPEDSLVLKTGGTDEARE